MRPRGGGSGDVTLAQARGDLLQRVDTNAWEPPQTGVEYYAPFQHGEFYNQNDPTGTVYRQYYSGTTGAAAIVLDATFDDLTVVGCGGTVLKISADTSCNVGSYFSAALHAVITVEAASLNLNVGTDLDAATDVYYLWIDYVSRKTVIA